MVNLNALPKKRNQPEFAEPAHLVWFELKQPTPDHTEGKESPVAVSRANGHVVLKESIRAAPSHVFISERTPLRRLTLEFSCKAAGLELWMRLERCAALSAATIR